MKSSISFGRQHTGASHASIYQVIHTRNWKLTYVNKIKLNLICSELNLVKPQYYTERGRVDAASAARRVGTAAARGVLVNLVHNSEILSK